MLSTQDKIQLWLKNESVEGRGSTYEELSETEANILVQRFATDVDSDDPQAIISIQKLELADGYKFKVETASGIGLSFKPAKRRK
jgi:hypothetical protein